jgi:hypothetical protein
MTAVDTPLPTTINPKGQSFRIRDFNNYSRTFKGTEATGVTFITINY